MKQESVFLGTGAAELYPNPFCRCAVCYRARRNNEKRLRASFLLDETFMVDFGPDVSAASQHYHVPLYDVEHVLVTHTHEDHFSSATFSVLTMTDMISPIHFYLSNEGLAWVDKVIEVEKDVSGELGYLLASLIKSNKVAFHAVKPYEAYDIGDKKVIPLKSNHAGYGVCEMALNYLIIWERGAWLYAVDTGLYGEENLTFLADYASKYGTLDTIIIEGTYGSMYMADDCGHMAANLLCKQFLAFRDIRLLDNHTRVYITHINQVQTFSHAEFQNHMNIHANAQVIVAYDGMHI